VDASDVLVPNKPLPSPGVVVEVDAEVVALSAGFGGSPNNPLPTVAVVVADESPGGFGGPLKKPPTAGAGSPAGLGGRPNNPPVVVLVLCVPPNSDGAAECGQHRRESKGEDFRIYLVLEHPCLQFLR